MAEWNARRGRLGAGKDDLVAHGVEPKSEIPNPSHLHDCLPPPSSCVTSSSCSRRVLLPLAEHSLLIVVVVSEVPNPSNSDSLSSYHNTPETSKPPFVSTQNPTFSSLLFSSLQIWRTHLKSL
ncbi:hypothetical protein PIB30_023191 [Stylosanthes scabra]|uniref:Uncharacterized protein n=1 Tax=Stylosanthes scabra TaxID=79078 RepID=A0ABU6VCF2_9FABA|nr:hypothetical protein [Stylosanthes scabra]